MASDWADELKGALWIGLCPNKLALILPSYDRHTAVKLFTAINKAFVKKTDYEFDAGVAAVELAPKGFDSSRLIEAAQRCLDAAQTTGVPTVKSIEVY